MEDKIPILQGVTPGTWVAREQFGASDKTLGWIIEHANGRIGWSSYGTARPNKGEEPPYLTGGSNARLLSKAPELAQLCADMAEAIQASNLGIANYYGCEAADVCNKLLARARKIGVIE